MKLKLVVFFGCLAFLAGAPIMGIDFTGPGVYWHGGGGGP